jgi:nucleotide-binding universal stress UspA family protein
MGKTNSILAVAQHAPSDTVLLAKAAALARSFGFGLELFMCDAEQAYALKHDYQKTGHDKALAECIGRAKAYLTEQRKLIDPAVSAVGIDAACESPLYEGVVRKVVHSRAEFVMKAAGGIDRRGHSAFDENDWQRMRPCPATLALVRHRHWRKRLRIAAAIDVSDEETAGLATSIIRIARRLALATGGELELLYAERMPSDSVASRTRAARLRALARQADLDEHHAHILPGTPEHELAAFAAGRDYDVMALGALAHRKLAVELVGSLTSTLVEALESDFVLIKPDEAVVSERVPHRTRQHAEHALPPAARSAAVNAWMGRSRPPH